VAPGSRGVPTLRRDDCPPATRARPPWDRPVASSSARGWLRRPRHRPGGGLQLRRPAPLPADRNPILQTGFGQRASRTLCRTALTRLVGRNDADQPRLQVFRRGGRDKVPGEVRGPPAWTRGPRSAIGPLRLPTARPRPRTALRSAQARVSRRRPAPRRHVRRPRLQMGDGFGAPRHVATKPGGLLRGPLPDVTTA
jgi:hypothetical protein